VIKLESILAVWETLDSASSFEDLVDAVSRKYHIVNDAHLYYSIKRAVDANKLLFERKPITRQMSIENDLSKVITFEKFELAYSKFIAQAELNAKTQKSEGSKTPYGFDFAPKQNYICGGAFSQHFGQGAASKTPYISWHVVSIYYVPERQKVVLGIEESRYPHLKEMQPIKTEAIGKKDRYIAVFYECPKDAIDYAELYNQFIGVATQVIELGLV
jgi:hypothetical protein